MLLSEQLYTNRSRDPTFSSSLWWELIGGNGVKYCCWWLAAPEGEDSLSYAGGDWIWHKLVALPGIVVIEGLLPYG